MKLLVMYFRNSEWRFKKMYAIQEIPVTDEKITELIYQDDFSFGAVYDWIKTQPGGLRHPDDYYVVGTLIDQPRESQVFCTFMRPPINPK